jgi:hypothetical protein
MRNYWQMNRPYGAVDVSANLKGAVPKAATQKILVALAEKGELVQKTYGMSLLCISDPTWAGSPKWSSVLLLGKTTFFAPNQDRIETLSNEQLAEKEAAAVRMEDENKEIIAKIRVSSNGIPIFFETLFKSLSLFITTSLSLQNSVVCATLLRMKHLLLKSRSTWSASSNLSATSHLYVRVPPACRHPSLLRWMQIGCAGVRSG